MVHVLPWWYRFIAIVLIAQLAAPVGVAAAVERDLQVEELEQIKVLQEQAALWVLAIGVSKYQDQRISLQYADHDAIQVARAFEAQKGVLFREVFTRVLVNEQATRSEILTAMTEFLGQASEKDVIVVFLAGHGLQDRTTGTYYFVPHNASAANLMQEGLQMQVFEEAVKRLRVNVNKLVLLLDTCHAGAMTVSARGVNTGEDLAEILSQAEGQFVLSASKAGEESLEDEAYRLDGEDRSHGAFTYSLLRGMQGEAADTSGVVWLSDLFGHVSREVPRLTRGHQHPYGQTSGTDLPLLLLAEGASGSPDTKVQSWQPPPPYAAQQQKGSRKWLWLLLGVAAAGGAAATLGGGGGGGDAQGSVIVDITVP